MALPVLDGNQSATTLSSVVTGGEHIVAHTVVSLGSTAISNITSAVSGSVVSVSNFPSTQTIAGTVTANVFGQDENNVAQLLPLIETDGPNNVTRELAVSSIIVDNDGNSIFNNSDGSLGIPIAARRLGVPAAIDYITAENNRLDTNVKNSVTIGSLPAISGTVTVGNSVTVAGTVTANVFGWDQTNATYLKLAVVAGDIIPDDQDNHLIVRPRNSPLDPLSISGTVTANVNAADLFSQAPDTFIADDGASEINYGVQLGYFSVADDAFTLVKDTQPLPISGTVTVSQLPRVTFIDGSGTVTTANTAITVFASSSTRSYLLVQVTTGSAFVNVGATATTVNGINLTAGQGYAWETTIPQGVVSLISTTTNSAYVAKQA